MLCGWSGRLVACGAACRREGRGAWSCCGCLRLRCGGGAPCLLGVCARVVRLVFVAAFGRLLVCRAGSGSFVLWVSDSASPSRLWVLVSVCVGRCCWCVLSVRVPLVWGCVSAVRLYGGGFRCVCLVRVGGLVLRQRGCGSVRPLCSVPASCVSVFVCVASGVRCVVFCACLLSSLGPILCVCSRSVCWLRGVSLVLSVHACLVARRMGACAACVCARLDVLARASSRCRARPTSGWPHSGGRWCVPCFWCASSRACWLRVTVLGFASECTFRVV